MATEATPKILKAMARARIMVFWARVELDEEEEEEEDPFNGEDVAAYSAGDIDGLSVLRLIYIEGDQRLFDP